MIDKDNQAEPDFSFIPEEIRSLVRGLISEEGMSRMKARNLLVKQGPANLLYFEMLLHTDNRLLRWETAKVIEEIADEASVPLFLDLLEDSDDDIRWIAAEGLIRIGKKVYSAASRKAYSQRGFLFYESRCASYTEIP